MGCWVMSGGDWDWIEPEPAKPELLHVTENPVVNELLDAKGNTIRQWRERPPFGFR